MFAAMIMAKLENSYSIRQLFSKLKIWKIGSKWYLIALSFTLIQVGFAMMVYKGFSGSTPKIPSDYSIALLPIIFLVLFFQVGLSEELGWRGYALPKLQSKYSALKSSIILGLVWAFWHVGSFLVPGSFHDSVPLLWYILDTILFTIVLTWVFNNTKGSLLLAVLFHVAVDVTAGYLPYFFEYKGIYISVIINAIAVAGIIGVSGHKHLSKKHTKITFEEYSNVIP
jgi:membrane protease YdiL (CAAX protease family)